MNYKQIQPIVEGKCDIEAVRILIRRILQKHQHFDISVLRPHMRGDLPSVKKRLGDFFEMAALEKSPILCVLDFDCTFCKDVLAEENWFREEVQKLRPGYPFEACFIVKEFESLFLWDQAAICNLLPVRSGYPFPINPEANRGAKQILTDALVKGKGKSYNPTLHQAKLSSAVDLDLLAKCSPSYQRLEKAVLKLIKHSI